MTPDGLPRRVAKPWGEELIWALTDRYCGKRITIEPGRRLSLQRHDARTSPCSSSPAGCDSTWRTPPGTCASMTWAPATRGGSRSGRRHRFEAGAERVELIEVSTPELDDVVRLEDDYGREGTSAP
jgi:mannose-6-phosphate isomerase